MLAELTDVKAAPKISVPTTHGKINLLNVRVAAVIDRK
jgi:hypothetical protein